MSSELRFRDHLGRWKARWGIGRLTYMVPPGLYAIGIPVADSPVVVTANYKMSYDLVRSSLEGQNIWLLVLETFGINVWCAAGKGTFGTSELVRQLKSTQLEKVVTHRTILLPILGASGIAAHEVTKQTGFKVQYASIRAADLPDYLSNGMVTTPAMQQLTFGLSERIVLIPIEFVQSLKFVLPVACLLFILGWLFAGISTGLMFCSAILGAVAVGNIAVPALLPWLPGASFAFKGFLAGFLWSGLWLFWSTAGLSVPTSISAVLVLTTVSSFYAMNFTGSTPFTSRSGVRKEMHIALPLMGIALFISTIAGAWALLS